MATEVFTVRGTSESVGSPNNLLTFVTRHLDLNKYLVSTDLNYPASIGPNGPGINPGGPSEEQSVNQGVDIIAEAVRRSPNVVGLLGYSLGAETVSRFLERKAQGEFSDCQLAWVGMVANPNRSPGESIDNNSVGYGINGVHSPYPLGLPVFNAANPQDGITSCPEGSPLRTLADHVSNFTFAGTSWSQDEINRLLTNRWQPTDPYWWAHPVETWKKYNTAAALMRGYLFDGQHEAHYINDGYCSRLAARLNQL